MPDLIACLHAFLAAVAASVMIVAGFRSAFRKSGHSMTTAVCVLAVGAGSAIGYRLLQFAWSWPPRIALDRFLTIVLPASVTLELLAGIVGIGRPVDTEARHSGNAVPLSRVLAPVLRFGLYACAGRILLHGSVYLSGVGSGSVEAWSQLTSIALLCGSVVALTVMSTALCRMARRPAAGSITLSLAMCIVCAGMSTMLAGYIKGGVAAVPLAASLIGITLAAPLLGSDIRSSGSSCLQGAIGIGVIGLFSLVCVGRFFGQMNSLGAVVIFVSPLLCWISELPPLRTAAPWRIFLIRIVSVTIPLSAVLFSAKSEFDFRMAPLLATESRIALRPGLVCLRIWENEIVGIRHFDGNGAVVKIRPRAAAAKCDSHLDCLDFPSTGPGAWSHSWCAHPLQLFCFVVCSASSL